MRKTIFLSLLLSVSFFAWAQEEENSMKGHYLGLQVNELARQILSFGTTSNPSNPYFLNYTYTSESGGGINVGFAYTLDKIDNSNDFNDITTDINNLAIRVGYDKKNRIGKRFVYGAGVDVVIDVQKNETINSDSFSSQEITTVDKLTGWGLGPRLTFHYQIHKSIWIGTEANYYFKSLKDSFEIDFGSGSSNNDEQETKIRQFNFSAPAILWLTIRF